MHSMMHSQPMFLTMLLKNIIRVWGRGAALEKNGKILNSVPVLSTEPVDYNTCKSGYRPGLSTILY